MRNPRHIACVLAGATASQIGAAMCIAIFPVIAPQLAAHLNVDASLIGYQVSLLFGSAVAMGPFVATIVLRWGACRAMQGSCLAAALAMAVSLTGSLLAMMFASMLIGVSAGLVSAGSAHVCTRFASMQHRNIVFSVKQTGLPIAWALVALFAPAVALRWGWQAAMTVLLIVNLCVMFALQGVRASWDDDRTGDATVRVPMLEGWNLLWRDRRLRYLSASSFCFSVVQSCLGAFTVVMLVQELEFELIAAGIVLTVAQIAGVSGRLALGWYADVTGRGIAALGLAGLIAAVCCVAAAFLSSTWPVWLIGVLYAIFGAAIYSWNGVFHAQLSRLSPPGKISIAIGGIMIWIYGGVLVGPAAFATIYRALGNYTTVFGLLAVVALAGWAFTRPASAIDQKS